MGKDREGTRGRGEKKEGRGRASGSGILLQGLRGIDARESSNENCCNVCCLKVIHSEPIWDRNSALETRTTTCGHTQTLVLWRTKEPGGTSVVTIPTWTVVTWEAITRHTLTVLTGFTGLADTTRWNSRRWRLSLKMYFGARETDRHIDISSSPKATFPLVRGRGLTRHILDCKVGTNL